VTESVANAECTCAECLTMLCVSVNGIIYQYTFIPGIFCQNILFRPALHIRVTADTRQSNIKRPVPKCFHHMSSTGLLEWNGSECCTWHDPCLHGIQACTFAAPCTWLSVANLEVLEVHELAVRVFLRKRDLAKRQRWLTGLRTCLLASGHYRLTPRFQYQNTF
jgi:hypothetical protein